MCEAVTVCHDVGVYHRDIKLENFTVTDRWFEGRSPSRTSKERRVVVKFTDFGLSMKEVESCNMDCGSAPYMSYGMSLADVSFFVVCRNGRKLIASLSLLCDHNRV
jgi:serine/threonine protein kinase